VTQIAFHFNVSDKLTYACRLARKALHQRAKVLMLCPAPLQQTLSPMLWGLSPTDFIAHACEDSDVHVLAYSPIVLLSAAHAAPHHDTLLNLRSEVPEGFERFARVIEIVPASDDDERRQARLRWKHYSASGHPIVRHDVARPHTPR